jgi:hypothetical protein
VSTLRTDLRVQSPWEAASEMAALAKGGVNSLTSTPSINNPTADPALFHRFVRHFSEKVNRISEKVNAFSEKLNDFCGKLNTFSAELNDFWGNLNKSYVGVSKVGGGLNEFCRGVNEFSREANSFCGKLMHPPEEVFASGEMSFTF